jgi:hypothetical protein
MSVFVDARVPVSISDIAETSHAAAPPPEICPDHRVAWLVEGDLPMHGAIVARFALGTDHQPGCACCLPRGAAAAALGELFLRRARGELAFFDRVQALSATPAGLAAIHAALRDDPFVSGRFRAAAPPT